MVAKKYLCAAPRQEVWDEKAEAMLKSLKGSMKKKRKFIKKTLLGLQEEHGHEKRSGPGRKSNAYYAITYFEYALEKAREGMDDDDDDASSGSESEAEEEKPHAKPQASARNKSTSKSEEAEEEKTIESMDSQEFLNEHNDLCDVCNEGGELICCSTCNLVFHLGCIRPALENVPKGDWSCPYCVLSGTAVWIPGKPEKQPVKRNSKLWRAAAVGVRQMGRLRALANNLKKDKDKGTASESKEGEGTNSAAAGTATPAKKNADDEATSPADLTTPPLRGKRSRRPVTLYNPQNCPASEWQSDEKFRPQQEETSQQEGSKNPETPTISRKRRRMEKKKQEEGNDEESSQEDGDNDSTASAFCKFCNDDPEIPLCVFCGCRVCFSKKDKQKLLLCDGCDEEYHLYCLDPPLAAPPKASQSWYCPSCTKERTAPKPHKTRRSATAAAKAMSSSPTAITPRSTGRTASKIASKPTSKPASKPTSTGRPRGRPPKNASAKNASSKSASANTAGTTLAVPKRRGRPPKNANKVAQTAAIIPAPRKRGRPPKNASAAATSDSKRKQAPSGAGQGSSKKARQTPTTTTTAKPISAAANAARKVQTLPSAARKVATLPSAAAMDHIIRSGRGPRVPTIPQPRSEPTRDQAKIKPATTAAVAPKIPTVAKKAPVAASSAQVKQAPVPKKPPAATTTPGPMTGTSKSKAIAPQAPANTAVAQKMGTKQTATKMPANSQRPAGVPTQALAGKSPSSASPIVAPGAEALGAQGAPTAKKTGVTPPANPVQARIASVAPTGAKAAAPVAKTPLTTTGAAIGVKKPAAATPSANKTPTIAITTRQPQGKLEIPVAPIVAAVKKVASANPHAKLDIPGLVSKAIRQSAAAARADVEEEVQPSVAPAKAPRRKPGARECMQISRRFGLRVIPQKYMDTLLDYCTRGKVEHLIRMRERLDEHSRFLEAQLAGLEAVIRDVGETDVVVPALPDRPDTKPHAAPSASR